MEFFVFVSYFFWGAIFCVALRDLFGHVWTCFLLFFFPVIVSSPVYLYFLCLPCFCVVAPAFLVFSCFLALVLLFLAFVCCSLLPSDFSCLNTVPVSFALVLLFLLSSCGVLFPV